MDNQAARLRRQREWTRTNAAAGRMTGGGILGVVCLFGIVWAVMGAWEAKWMLLTSPIIHLVLALKIKSRPLLKVALICGLLWTVVWAVALLSDVSPGTHHAIISLPFDVRSWISLKAGDAGAVAHTGGAGAMLFAIRGAVFNLAKYSTLISAPIVLFAIPFLLRKPFPTASGTATASGKATAIGAATATRSGRPTLVWVPQDRYWLAEAGNDRTLLIDSLDDGSGYQLCGYAGEELLFELAPFKDEVAAKQAGEALATGASFASLSSEATLGRLGSAWPTDSSGATGAIGAAGLGVPTGQASVAGIQSWLAWQGR